MYFEIWLLMTPKCEIWPQTEIFVNFDLIFTFYEEKYPMKNKLCLCDFFVIFVIFQFQMEGLKIFTFYVSFSKNLENVFYFFRFLSSA